MTRPSLVPHLVVRDCPKAIDFYVKALGAREESRYTDHKRGFIVHAELSIGGSLFSLAEENREFKREAPPSLGGSPVVLSLDVADAHAAARRMQEHGAEVVYPVADQFYGMRQGRLRDPFGHLWILSQLLEELAPEEIQRRVDQF